MKRLILCILSALFCITINAEIKRENNTFKVEQTTKASDKQTEYTWEDKAGNIYPIFITKKGTCYIIRVSKKSGKEYKYYLPKNIQETIKKELNIQ